MQAFAAICGIVKFELSNFALLSQTKLNIPELRLILMINSYSTFEIFIADLQ